MDEFIEVGGVRFRYRIEGAGDWLVFVHGVGGSLEQWDKVVPALGGRFRTLRYDQRGHGQSSKPAGPYSAEGFAADLKRLADALGIDRFDLVGQSLGGLVAQAFALAYPERLKRMLLFATVAGRNEAEREAVLERLRIVENGIPNQHFHNSIERWFTDAFRQANPDLMRAYAERNSQNDPAAYAAAYRVLATTDFSERLQEIRTPTLIATGEGDRGSNPRMARLMHDRIQDSELVILPGLRHALPYEAPEQVARLIEGFLEDRKEV